MREVGSATVQRRGFLRLGAAAGAAFVGARVAGGRGTADAAPSKAQDRKILNFALTLEYLQAAFYTDAVKGGALRGELREFAEVVAAHERDHVAFLRKALGGFAVGRPTFDFGSATRSEKAFGKTALELENLGVAAYNGQAANLTRPTLAAAASIVSVEGRHAAWISDILGREPAPRAADPGLTAAQVTAAVRATGYIKR